MRQQGKFLGTGGRLRHTKPGPIVRRWTVKARVGDNVRPLQEMEMAINGER